MEIPQFGSVSVIIERKKMSSCRLKVFPSQKVKLSVPIKTSSEWVDSFLQIKKDWITEKLEKFKKTKGYEVTDVIHNGMSIRMLGRDMVFSIFKSDKKHISLEDKIIRIGLPDISDEQEVMRLFETWWRKNALSEYNEILEKLYSIIEKHNIKRPVLFVRKMKTLWGSSSPHKGNITVNLYLLKAKRPCIEYVILHELVHFIFPYHNQKFFDFITIYMPDWKDRKKVLDTEVVQGL